MQKPLHNLGIVHRRCSTDDEGDSCTQQTQWSRFAGYLRHLNQRAQGPRFKVFFAGRHGEAVHNAKEGEVGRPEWQVGDNRLASVQM